MANRTVKETAAAATPSTQSDGQPPGAVETAIAAATALLLPPPRDDEAVRRLAYAYYEERGRADGHHLDDWLRAEAELGAADARR
jgi:hypothetical protein